MKVVWNCLKPHLGTKSLIWNIYACKNILTKVQIQPLQTDYNCTHDDLQQASRKRMREKAALETIPSPTKIALDSKNQFDSW